jgi:hypothetical protein
MAVEERAAYFAIVGIAHGAEGDIADIICAAASRTVSGLQAPNP